MKKRINALLSLNHLLFACGFVLPVSRAYADLPLKYSPAVPAGHTIVEFELVRFVGPTDLITVDLMRGEMSGSIFNRERKPQNPMDWKAKLRESKEIDDWAAMMRRKLGWAGPRRSVGGREQRRFRLSQPVKLQGAARETVEDVLLHLGKPETPSWLSRLLTRDSIRVDGDFDIVCSFGPDYRGKRSSCSRLLVSRDGFSTIKSVFLNLKPREERVYWAVGEYRIFQDQPPKEERESLLQRLQKADPDSGIRFRIAEVEKEVTLILHSTAENQGLRLSGSSTEWLGDRLRHASIRIPILLGKAEIELVTKQLAETETISRSAADCPGGEYERLIVKKLTSPFELYLRSQPPYLFFWPADEFCNFLSSSEIFRTLEQVFFSLKPEERILRK